MLVFERLQPLHHLIEFEVADLGRCVEVVETVVSLQLGAKVLDFLLRFHAPVVCLKSLSQSDQESVARNVKLSAAMSRKNHTIVRLIAVFKLLKALSLILGGFGALQLLSPSTGPRLQEWLAESPIAGRQLAEQTLSRLSGMPAKHLEGLGIVLFGYAALFLTEGIGLLLERRWAEYLTVIATASFIPLEVYEIVKQATAVRIVLLVVNIAVVIYLIVRLKTDARDSATARRSAR
jgi:uncharacterized membrane protein (DUF2068 family)